jgi:hypothetical protein
MTDHTMDPRFIAGVQMLGRTGALNFRIAHSDEEEDGLPVIWHATASYAEGIHEAAAALDPVRAVLRLCEQLVDGGQCKHCGKTTIFEPELDDMLDPYQGAFCLYAWDPELATFRRACEGGT